MNRIEIQNLEQNEKLSLEEMIISKSMNGWVLQLFQKFFDKNN
nr:hypothetical protein [uncultured Flavobacterium sp.]